MGAFSPERLDIARQRRGITKRTLADAVNITPTALQHYANLRRVPTPEIVDRLASILDFPKEFFYDSDLDLPPVSGTSYRALSRTTARHRMQAEAIGAIGTLFAGWIEARFDLPSPDIPEYDTDDPESAAEVVRYSWGIGAMSITNLVALMEIHGIRVFSLATDTPDLDAFSFWHGAVPYVFLNTFKTPERTRMDAAHELGHLVLHSKGNAANRDRQAERDAQHFAAAFLMPRTSVAANFPFSFPTASLDQFRESKKQWNVSLTSLIVRVRDLEYINSNRYRTLMIEASERGYRRREPDGCAPDHSIVLDKLFSRRRKGAESIPRVARELSVYPAELYCLMKGLVPFPVPVA